MDSLVTLARARIADGRLPNCGANQLAAKFGDGAVCDVCGRTVSGSTPMYRLTFAAREFVMHVPCFMAWVGERGPTVPQAVLALRAEPRALFAAALPTETPHGSGMIHQRAPAGALFIQAVIPPQ